MEDIENLSELHDVAAHAVELLKAMANEWRLMILCQLAEGEKTVSELQEILGLSQSALSQQLARLRGRETAQMMRYFWETIESCVPPAAILDAEVLGRQRGEHPEPFAQLRARVAVVEEEPGVEVVVEVDEQPRRPLPHR